MAPGEQLLVTDVSRVMTRVEGCIGEQQAEASMRTAKEELVEQHNTMALAFRTLLAQVKTMAQQLPIETGVCCCGSPMEGHTFYDGHQPRDEGEYFVTQAIMDAEKALGQ